MKKGFLIGASYGVVSHIIFESFIGIYFYPISLLTNPFGIFINIVADGFEDELGFPIVVTSLIMAGIIYGIVGGIISLLISSIKRKRI